MARVAKIDAIQCDGDAEAGCRQRRCCHLVRFVGIDPRNRRLQGALYHGRLPSRRAVSIQVVRGACGSRTGPRRPGLWSAPFLPPAHRETGRPRKRRSPAMKKAAEVVRAGSRRRQTEPHRLAGAICPDGRRASDPRSAHIRSTESPTRPVGQAGRGRTSRRPPGPGWRASGCPARRISHAAERRYPLPPTKQEIRRDRRTSRDDSAAQRSGRSSGQHHLKHSDRGPGTARSGLRLLRQQRRIAAAGHDHRVEAVEVARRQAPGTIVASSARRPPPGR